VEDFGNQKALKDATNWMMMIIVNVILDKVRINTKENMRP
jgi:hypothetical protein